MLQRIQERRRGLIVTAAVSLAVSTVVGLLFALLAGVPLTGKSPPPLEILSRMLDTTMNAAAVVFWFLFVPQAVVELSKLPESR